MIQNLDLVFSVGSDSSRIPNLPSNWKWSISCMYLIKSEWQMCLLVSGFLFYCWYENASSSNYNVTLGMNGFNNIFHCLFDWEQNWIPVPVKGDGFIFFWNGGITRPSLCIEWCIRLFINLLVSIITKSLHHGSHKVDICISHRNKLAK
jgi:hypothetical protein